MFVKDSFTSLGSDFNHFDIGGSIFFVSPYVAFLNVLSGHVSRNYKRKLKAIVKESFNLSIFVLIKILNKEIENFKFVHSFLASYVTLSQELDCYTYKLLWRFVKRCHPRRSNTWIYGKFWKSFSRST